MIIKWHGSVQEFERLHEAVHRNCLCEFDAMDNLIKQCPAHAMIDSEQRALDGLLFMYVNRERLLEEEYREPTSD